MPNLFDRANYPTSEPAVLTVGEYWRWKKDDLVGSYPTADYSLRYNARLQTSAATEIEITATEADSKYYIEVPIATTASYTAGDYNWQLTVIRASDSEEIVVLRGIWTIKADLNTDTGDPRSHAKTMVDLIEALMEGRAVSDVSNYAIEGRSLTKLSIEELREWRNYYKTEYNKELRAARVAQGKSAKNNIYIKFN